MQPAIIINAKSVTIGCIVATKITSTSLRPETRHKL